MHVEISKHKNAVREEASSAKITDRFCKPGTQTEDNVAAANATMSFHTYPVYKTQNCGSFW